MRRCFMLVYFFSERSSWSPGSFSGSPWSSAGGADVRKDDSPWPSVILGASTAAFPTTLFYATRRNRGRFVAGVRRSRTTNSHEDSFYCSICVQNSQGGQPHQIVLKGCKASCHGIGISLLYIFYVVVGQQRGNLPKYVPRPRQRMSAWAP